MDDMSTSFPVMHAAPEPRWLNDAEQRAWRCFLALQIRLHARLSQQLQRETGLSETDYEVLVNLSEAPNYAMRAFELGDATQWEKSRLSHHLTRMADRGLVVRQACPTDNRGTFVVLTAAGRMAIEGAAPQHVEHVRRAFLDMLSPTELETLRLISDRVIARIVEDERSEQDSCPN
jgi:DNA-binding MarR family transcriptional regulator